MCTNYLPAVIKRKKNQSQSIFQGLNLSLILLGRIQTSTRTSSRRRARCFTKMCILTFCLLVLYSFFHKIVPGAYWFPFYESRIKTFVLNTTEVLEFVIQFHHRSTVVGSFKWSLFLVNTLWKTMPSYCLQTAARTQRMMVNTVLLLVQRCPVKFIFSIFSAT